MSFSKITTAALLSFSAITNALPTAQAASSSDAPSANQEYYLGLQAVGYPTLSLNLFHTGAGEAQGVFERISAYPGTPAYLDNTYLNFDVGTSTPYSAFFEEVGDNYGTKVPFLGKAGSDVGRTGFGIGSDNKLYARLDSGVNHFFACNTTVDGQDILGLFFGVYNEDGSAPADCVTADIIAAKKTT